MHEIVFPTGLILAGLIALGVGGEMLVRGASRLAAVARITPLVIGLTVVAFGTSSPELAVSLKASIAGQTDIAIGNVVGSNILNVLFILGVCRAHFAPDRVESADSLGCSRDDRCIHSVVGPWKGWQH